MTLERIRVDLTGRFLMTESGQPFFWLADTAWELFHRLSLEEAEHYFETRRCQGFNVIQAVLLAELDGLHTPNVYGHLPLLGNDPTLPNEPYFRFVDEIIRLAADKGLYIGLLPTWADKITAMWGIGPEVFNHENIRTYGKYLGNRYKAESNILWILGGDRPVAGYEPLWHALADGITEGLGYRPFMTFHPVGRTGSADWLHNADWLDMNMWQSGHQLMDTPNWEMIAADYRREPPKPVLDAEPSYEDHPVDPFLRSWIPEFGRYTDYDVRKLAYRAVFSGACGHTYGHHSVWQFWTADRTPVNHPTPAWQEALLKPGAAHMVYLKNLLLSRPYFSRIPDQALVPDEQAPPVVENLELDRYHPVRAAHVRATRCCEGDYGMVYFPLSEQCIQVDLRLISGRVRTWWYDPRSGRAFFAGEYPAEIVQFTSPAAGPDWVLVLDNAEKDFDAPGTCIFSHE